MKKSKKIAATISGLICLLTCLCFIVGCGNDMSDQNAEPTYGAHNWSASYTVDGDTHYQTCTVCGEKKHGCHDYTDGNCVCGRECPADHNAHECPEECETSGHRHGHDNGYGANAHGHHGNCK